MSEKRTFKITESQIGYVGGSYKTNKSLTPLSAATHAAKVLFKLAKNEKNKPEYKKYEFSKDLIKFTIREKTQGSKKEEFQYEAKIKTLHGDEVKTIKRGDIEYTIRHKIVVRAAHYVKTPFGGSEEQAQE
jgi:hypothetical protein